MPKGFLPSEDTGQVFAFTEAAQGISFESMARHQQAAGRDRPAGPERRGLLLERRRLRPQHRRQPGPDLHAAQGRSERQAERRRGDRGAAGEGGGRSPASGSSCRTRRPSASAASSPRASTSSRSRAPTPTSSTAAPRSSRRSSTAWPDLQDVTSDLQIQNPQVEVVDRPRPGPGARRERPAGRGRALHRLRHPLDLDHLRAQQRVPRDPGAGARAPARGRRTSRRSTSARPAAAWSRSRRWPG